MGSSRGFACSARCSPPPCNAGDVRRAARGRRAAHPRDHGAPSRRRGASSERGSPRVGRAQADGGRAARSEPPVDPRHEEERALLARELHDDVTQRLAVLAIDIGRVESAAPEGAPARALQRCARTSCASARTFIPWRTSCTRRCWRSSASRGAPGRVRTTGAPERVRPLDDPRPAAPVVGKDAALCLFRVAQEALTNAARHSVRAR